MRKIYLECRCLYCDTPVQKGKSNTDEMWYCPKEKTYLDRDEVYHSDEVEKIDE